MAELLEEIEKDDSIQTKFSEFLLPMIQQLVKKKVEKF